MKKRLLVALVLTAMSFFVFVGVPRVKAMPFGYFNKYSKTTWGGTVNGASTITAISDPGLAQNSEWNRHLELVANPSGDTVDIGFEKFSTAQNAYYCGNYQIGLYQFVSWSIPGSSSGKTCFPVPPGDVNQYGTIKIWNDSSTGDVEFQISGFPENFGCSPGPCSFAEHGNFPVWNDINLIEGINNTFTGHNVWGVSWSDNSYQNSSGWHLQTMPSGCPNQNGCQNPVGNPPQMFWHNPPSNSSTGGDLYVCSYDTGTTCNIGS